MSADDISRAIRRMAYQLDEQLADNSNDVVLLGIITRGAPLAARVAGELSQIQGSEIPVGRLDITMYRDDLRHNPARPVGRTVLPRSIDDAVVVLVDDVLYSGRTIQAALHALADLGRPKAIWLVTLVDRGHRELPIQAQVVGKTLPTARAERVLVRLAETDGIDEVRIDREAV